MVYSFIGNICAKIRNRALKPKDSYGKAEAHYIFSDVLHFVDKVSHSFIKLQALNVEISI